MAYVPNVDWDVFISYARNDDKPLREGEKGWISAFVHALRVAVSQFMGEEVRFFFDLEDAGAGFEDLEFIKKCAANSALMVSVVSPTYCRREWTLAELSVFCAKWRDNSRLLALERLPIGTRDEPPEVIWQKNRLGFWHDVPNATAKAPLPPSSDRFNDLLMDFADRLKTRLWALHTERGGETPPPPPEGVRTILLAQGTDDVAESIEKVRDHLGQYPDAVRILPAEDYPQGGGDFDKAFRKDLETADIFVQLLGARAGRAPPDLPQGYTRYQLEVAKAAGKTIMQWRHPELDVETVANEAYRALLADPRVIVCGFEEFKSQVLDCARRPPASPPPPVEHTKVFINADRENRVTADFIAELFSAQDFTPVFPKFDGTAQENRSHLDKMMTECGIVFVINAVLPPIWFDNQKKLFEMIRPTRKAKPTSLAVCTLPPAKHLDREIIGDEFEEIDCSDGDTARVRDYIASLKQRGPEPAPQPFQPAT